jgi:hypothetical protein
MRQAGSIVRKRKKYYVVYRTPAKTQKWEGGFDTKAAAQQRLTEIRGDIRKGSYFERSDKTLGSSPRSGSRAASASRRNRQRERYKLSQGTRQPHHRAAKVDRHSAEYNAKNGHAAGS